MLTSRARVRALIAVVNAVLAAFLAFAQSSGAVGATSYETNGVRDALPVFHERLSERMTFPMSWLSGNYRLFETWKRDAREKVEQSLLLLPPDAPFEPRVVDEQDRGSHTARKVSFNVTADSRVLGLMTLPKGKGPHPAVLLLHDHGAKFDIGKEKLIEPWGEPAERVESARAWVGRYYGGRFIGDELAKRGFVCLSVDMLNWSDRGGGGYDKQQALAANLLQFGGSWAGLIAHEDRRAASFLASLPEVDSKRIGAMGLSVGGFRTWQVAALSEHVRVGVSVCWMATSKALLAPKNNQTTGQSAFTMTHPGLGGLLDYPDVASIACPKALFFACGERDALFPAASTREAFSKMRRVWESQGAGDRLVTRMYDAPHEFNQRMQEESFQWLTEHLSAH